MLHFSDFFWSGSLFISGLLLSALRALISLSELLSKQKFDLFLETQGFCLLLWTES